MRGSCTFHGIKKITIVNSDPAKSKHTWTDIRLTDEDGYEYEITVFGEKDEYVEVELVDER